MAEVIRFPSALEKPVVFNRQELGLLMSLYGRRVAEGEWRDYALNFGKETAWFSVFAHASQQPLYIVIKNPALVARAGLYSVVAQSGLTKRRGNELEQVLRVLEKRPKPI